MKESNLRRFLAFFLAFVLILVMIPVSVLAELGDEIIGDEEKEENDEQIVNFANATPVASAEELQLALADEVEVIRLTTGFAVDRTFRVTKTTYLFSEEAVTLTRSATFDGDMFVVGEYADGTLPESAVTLTLGHPESTTANLLTIDGNKDNMTVDVVGSVLYVVTGACVDLYPNVTIKNAFKNGNERTISSGYGVSYPPRIGGAVAILTNKSSMNIYGGLYTDNRTNDAVDSDDDNIALYSAQGGAFYNFGTLNIYGGTFSNNHASRGGFLFNYRTARIYNAVISGNTASSLGGAIYVPNSTAARLYLGGENAIADSNVLFENNQATSSGGAIYARTILEAENTVFRNNYAGSTGGAMVAYSMTMTIDSCTFEGNTAKSNGGAICFSGTNGKDDVVELSVTGTMFKNNATKTDGGALFLTENARCYVTATQFNENQASSEGGAVYATEGAQFDADDAEFFANNATGSGGAVMAYTDSVVKMNAVNASENAAKSGAFLHAASGANATVYNSFVMQNTASSNGGAMAFYQGASGGIYATTFDGNTSTGGNGGAIFFYTDGGEVTVNSAKFLNNSGSYGGAIYASERSVVHLYNNIATDNTAKKGGFLYHTTTATTIDLVGVTVSGNTASEGGPIIWGNSTGAVLNIDKGKYFDLDYTGDWDDAYWAEAIYNKLKVKEVIANIPNYIDYDGTEVVPKLPEIPSDVTTAAQLERALEAGKSLIRVTADFELDRTFYIPYDVTIYSTEAHTLTRAANFAGDIFVVGESDDGKFCNEKVTLTLGDKESVVENLLVIDGNKDNMTAAVTGSILFVGPSGIADLYTNVTICNAAKIGNARTLTEKYTVSYPARIGGAVAILTGKSTMNIYGGNYLNNSVNDMVDHDDDDVAMYSAHGGAIYNYGTLNVYGGLFKQNHASRGAFLFNYRTAHIYCADIVNNTASNLGGAIYMPNSTSAFLYVGEDNELAAGNVTFSGNSADSSGGAIYARNTVSIQNTIFTENHSDEYGGAIVAYTTVMTIENSVFEKNSSSKHGGAIYLSANNGKEKYEMAVSNCSFDQNTSGSNGGALYLHSGARASVVYSSFTGNTSSATGGAVYATDSTLDADKITFTGNKATTNGGAIALNTSSAAILNRITASTNSAKAGGFLHATAASTVKLYNSTISENTTTSGDGGAMYLYTDVSGGLYSTQFNNNTAVGHGGALFMYTNTAPFIVHSCSFNGNSGKYGGAIYASGKAVADFYNTTATNNVGYRGGFLYETTTGTTFTVVGLTLKGNTATDGAPIIWGNSTGAVLYLDKAKYVDQDHTGAYDSAYWSAAIYNKLTVKDYTGEIPKYLDYHEESYDHMASAVDVSNAAQLEAAINDGAPYIRVIADFEIDRTFYVWSQTTIFSTLPRTLTRAADFGGDIFVVGENAQGRSALLMGNNAKLTVGNPLSTKGNLLTINGNKENMTVPVAGTVFFIYYSGIVDLRENVSVINCYKESNERTYDERYHLSLRNRIGGALAIVANGTLNINGGYYAHNAVNREISSAEDDRISTIGGLIFNKSNVNIYDGVFESNEGARGAIVYNYTMLKIYGGQFLNNVATHSGGVTYTPNASGAHVHIGTAVKGGVPVIMQGNSAVQYGGALYTSALATLVIHGNTSFVENKTEKKQGGAITSYGQLTVRNATFSGNIANGYGGAVYAANSSNEYVTRHNTFDNCKFLNNQATLGGALSLYSSDSDLENGGKAIVTDCTFTANIAASPSSKTAGSSGGAIYMERRSELTMSDTTFKQNEARTEGGAIYAGGDSVITAVGCNFTENITQENGKHGGAVSLHSTMFTADDTVFSKNTANGNGAALYVSYSSACDSNSIVKLTNSSFKDNATEGYGAAIYTTRHDVTTEKRILDIRDTEFLRNISTGGAVYLQADVSVFMRNVTFTKNEATDGSGAAITANGADVEIDGGTFTENSASGSGGAIYIAANGTLLMNNIVAEGNAAEKNGGFLYSTKATVTLYNSTIRNHTAGSNGGALYLYTDAVTSVYATEFSENSSTTTGGALYIYTNGALVKLHSCTFYQNSSASGGAMYISKASPVEIYNVTATNNSADKGGFLYETTTGTTVLLVGATVSGNTATVGGPIIWGNSAGAILNINKNLYKDVDVAGPLDTAYWNAAIVNELTVKTVTTQIPTYKDYVSTPDGTNKPSTTAPVPVQEIFDLAQNSSDANINSYYNKLPKLDNSSNFMSQNVTTFPNINGGTVTVDTFVYTAGHAEGNCTVGEGLLIYQAMLYKKAHPDEEVSIDISAYRFSTQAAVNINRNSRYFGYMRQLSGRNTDYDQYGFVRLAYLLVSAAKMGIHVNAIGQLDGYPLTTGEDMISYFDRKLDLPCDPAYVENGIVSDYLTFRFCEWPLKNKGGTDMMHTKLCAVSHYLDMNGVEHRNAIWTSSSNLDGIKSSGANANGGMQTATIISDHADLYRVSVNYLRLVEEYSRYQEGVYEFQHLINTMNTEQTKLITEGRENEIPSDQQIVYLGSETDDVFELYFTPLGGGTTVWDELNSPYCKYLRKLYDSEDYILFSWNAAEYSGNFSLGKQMESMLVESFHNNRNPKNKFYGNMESFDPALLSDLKIGEDIGLISINKREHGAIHNKDLMFSYVEDGQRYYVTLHNSTNMHSGSMCYQSNFALVIKEKTCSPDSVFSTFAEHTTTTDFVEHTYGEELRHESSDPTQDGYTYVQCTTCGTQHVTGTIHHEGTWIVDREPTATLNGIQHMDCPVCGIRTKTQELQSGVENQVLANNVSGKTFTSDPDSLVPININEVPRTLEAVIELPLSCNTRGGVIVGNYADAGAQINLEIYYSGQPRLFYVNEQGERADILFTTDIRGSKPTHLAVTVDDNTATLYINGTATETLPLPFAYPQTATNFKVGGDNRKNYLPTFCGRIYSVSLFRSIRTTQDIQRDTVMVIDNDNTMLCNVLLREDNLRAPISIQPTGKLFAQTTPDTITQSFTETPLTLEATLQLSPSVNGDGGIILANYNAIGQEQIGLEVAENGKPKLVFIFKDGTKQEYIFDTDIRSESPVHLALTLNKTYATLYVNAKAVETMALTTTIPTSVSEFQIGGHSEQARPFQGVIYSVNLFADVRTAAEIVSDMLLVSDNTPGLQHSVYYTVEKAHTAAQTFTADNSINVPITQMPHTMEAIVHLPKHFTGRGGVIMGNYSGKNEAQIKLEIVEGGHPRVFVRSKYTASAAKFNADIRSDVPVHLAVTLTGSSVSLYINGEHSETRTLQMEIPDAYQNFRLGGDNTAGNPQYFKGKLYAATLFADVRTPEEIAVDTVTVPSDAEGLLYNVSFPAASVEQAQLSGQSFVSANKFAITRPVTAKIHTIEAVVQLPTTFTQRGGVLFGNYTGYQKNEMNFEIYTNGQPRLWYKSNGVTYSHLFTTDIRSDSPTHVALSYSDQSASLFVNGVLCETITLACPLPDIRDGFCIGSDNRTGNVQFFKGTVYSLSLFSDTRSENQIRQDSIFVAADDETVLYTKRFSTYNNETSVDIRDGKTFTAQTHLTLPSALSSTPKTLEAIITLPTDLDNRGGVILGNYDGSTSDQLNWEISESGQVRLFFINNGNRISHLFNTDVRSDAPIHLAMTLDGCDVSLYVNGEKVESITLAVPVPNTTDNFCLGGDNRNWNLQYFKGKIYSVALYSTVKSDEDIRQSAMLGEITAGDLLYSQRFTVSCLCEDNSTGFHDESEWIVDFEPTKTEKGIKHTECTACHTVLTISEMLPQGQTVDYTGKAGLTPTAENLYQIGETPSALKTLEVSFVLPKKRVEFARGGVLFSNYTGRNEDQISVEIYTNGQARFWYKVNQVTYSALFTADVRSDSLTHLAFTIDGNNISLYINGVYSETLTMDAAVPSAFENLCIGGDYRYNNEQYFKGTIYAVNVFDDIRTAEEIADDAILVTGDTDGLLYSKYFTNPEA